MKILNLLAILFLLTSCNGQNNKEKNKQEKTMEQTATGKNSPYNVFHEGEMNIDFVDFINTNKEKIQAELNKKGYKKPSETVFESKIKAFYNWDIKEYSNIIALQQSMLSEIAVKDLGIVFVEGSNTEIEADLLYNYNQFIFYNDKAALTWIKAKRPDLLQLLVKSYGFTKDDEILKFVFDKVNFKNSFDIREIIFGTEDNKLVLREEIVKKIRQIKYKEQTVAGFSETVAGDFYTTIVKNINDIVKNPKNYKDPDRYVAFLLNELALSGITGDIDSILNNNVAYLKMIKDNKYYNFDELKSYLENNYDSSSAEISDIYFINDADGYTNLRKEKSSTSEVLQKITAGEEVQVLDKNGDWWQVQTNEGKKGYVFKTKIGVR